MKDQPIEQVVNNDGTWFNPPENPLWDKWLKQYPPSPKPEYSQVCDGYSCMWCGRCPRGEYWEIPEEDKEEYEAYIRERDAYIKEHNVVEKLDSMLQVLLSQPDYAGLAE